MKTIEGDDAKTFTLLLIETLESMFPSGTGYFLIVGPGLEPAIGECIGVGNFNKVNSLRILKEAMEKVEVADEGERRLS